ncbi:aspartic peptidase domain-containing protein [Coprinopsis sp. MPI-PUGE-AT-0042]|nr:aspartic peptidase domain-containing protein [Coprinopsis sp. MPI-PUGE-AT-0042]
MAVLRNFCLWLGLGLHTASALRLEVTSKLERRATLLDLTNQADRRYITTLEIEGTNYTVLVDTGSSDLWVAGHVDGTYTGTRGEVRYAKDAVEGPIKTASLRLGEYHVPDQAILEVAPSSKHVAGTGILGLGPSTGSFIKPLLDNNTASQADGTPLLYRIFQKEPTTPNYFTLLLGREKDPTDDYTGTLTVGEVLPDYAAILSEPQLKISIPPATNPSATGVSADDAAAKYAAHQHLQVLLDEDGIIGPDGQVVPFKSSVNNTENANKATVVFDSGFSLPQVSGAVAEGIYGRFPGAELNIVQGVGYVWVLPCAYEVNTTFKFGGKEFPMHPLDMTMEPEPLGLQPFSNARGESLCIGTFQPFTFAQGDAPTYDLILGMAFMRNVYTLFDYGDFVANSTDLADPYIQLLSVTDPEEAHSDFLTARLDGVEPESKPRLKPLADAGDADGPSNSPDDVGGRKAQRAIVASVATIVGVLLVVLCFTVWYVRRKRIRARTRSW